MEGNLHSAVPTASRTGETTRPRAHTGPPLVPHRHLHHPPLSRASALHRGGVPDADCGPRNFIIGPTPVARPSPPPLGISASARRLPLPPLLRPAAARIQHPYVAFSAAFLPEVRHLHPRRCSLALPGYTHTGFKLGMDWAAPPEVLHAPDRSGIPQTLYGNWQWQGYWGG